MTRFFCSDLPHRWRKGCHFVLAFFWLTGLVSGILVCLSAGDSFVSWMRSTVYWSVSIVGLLFVTIFPFLISAFAVFISRPGLLLPICFCKAFLFSLVSMGTVQAFGSAGWLIRCLLLFSDCVSVPLLYWYWLRFLPGTRTFCGWETVAILALGALIGSVDYRIISPFLVHLIKF